jgi:hypothetical protein
MSYEIPSFYLGVIPADMDLTTKNFCAADVRVAISTLGAGVGGAGLVTPTLGGTIVGVIQNAPALGEAVQLMEAGVTKVVAGGPFVIGDLLAVDANGHFIKAISTYYVVAKALETGSAGVIAAVLLKDMGVLP